MNPTYWQSVWDFKRRIISEAIARHAGNVSRAARELGMHRNTLDRQLALLRPGGRLQPQRTRRKPVETARIDRMLEIVSQQQKMKKAGSL